MNSREFTELMFGRLLTGIINSFVDTVTDNCFSDADSKIIKKTAKRITDKLDPIAQVYGNKTASDFRMDNIESKLDDVIADLERKKAKKAKKQRKED